MALVQRNLYMGGGESGSTSSTSVGDEEACAVCLEEMVEGGKEVVRTPCKHKFHGGCIRRWFEESGFCPLCRFNIGP
ncbi:hypothetical protein KFK09_024713 [Dendrobium nobile]|uniref:RING-type domain-containing protein n=1 Tax=Dendrobium nobile TaxID=94219 RepID=A0A8T3AER5_DENNO|nr:hypothetical protein KFK09_024713 [Dendrobium nobile]